MQYTERQVFSIGTVAAYSAKYSALITYEILELFQYYKVFPTDIHTVSKKVIEIEAI